jgi:hypothetical protein
MGHRFQSALGFIEAKNQQQTDGQFDEEPNKADMPTRLGTNCSRSSD